jgi:hypothetical protein
VLVPGHVKVTLPGTLVTTEGAPALGQASVVKETEFQIEKEVALHLFLTQA